MMKETNPPAFPQPTTADGYTTSTLGSSDGGMSLRDYFAAKAMQAAIGYHGMPERGDGFDYGQSMKSLTEGAYQIADAMINERSNP